VSRFKERPQGATGEISETQDRRERHEVERTTGVALADKGGSPPRPGERLDPDVSDLQLWDVGSSRSG
jgi:hypothetical protein